MAQRVITRLVDDLTGKELREGHGETVTFALDGTTYEIDLSERNAHALRSVLGEFIGSARKVARRHEGRDARSKLGPSPMEVRSWAKAMKIEVPDRGRIPADIRAKFDAAN